MPVTHSSIVNTLKERREVAGLSQLDLAERAGVSRQAVIQIEAGRQVPSTRLALQLARTLGCGVDDLFQLVPEDVLPVVIAPSHPRGDSCVGDSRRVAVGRPAGVWVAHRIPNSEARSAADGIILETSSDKQIGAVRNEPRSQLHVSGLSGLVQPLGEIADLEENGLVAGCAPLLGILAQRVGSRYGDARATWIPANSKRALDLLDAGMVHIAGMHLSNAETGDDNMSVVRKRFGERRMVVINLTRWRQGFVVAPGNPLAIRGPDDLLRSDLCFARREPGAGATQLLRRLLARANGGAPIAAGVAQRATLDGPLVTGHGAVAQLVRSGAADVGVAIESAAIAACLDFLPIAEERFDLVVPAEYLDNKPISRLLDVLVGRPFRTEAQQLPGYDVSISGQTTRLEAA